MKIAIHGLGRMGMQIAHKLADDQHQVIAHNRSLDKVEEAVNDFNAIKTETKEQVMQAFNEDEIVVIWLMLPAEVVDQQVDEWFKLLPTGSIIIDGGNSDFRLTKKLNQHLMLLEWRALVVGIFGLFLGSTWLRRSELHNHYYFQVVDYLLVHHGIVH